jgi:PTS hybrid protein
MTAFVGLVLVSHSERLAEGVREVVTALGSSDLPVAVAGGDDDGGLGTSYARLEAAVATVDRGAGVVVLGDIGSSILTAKLFVAEAARDDVVLVDAPLVEGAVSAGVTAAAGADLSAVVSAAEEARTTPKLS